MENLKESLALKKLKSGLQQQLQDLEAESDESQDPRQEGKQAKPEEPTSGRVKLTSVARGRPRIRSRSRERNRSRGRRSRSRSLRKEQCTKMHVGLQHDLVRRPAINTDAASSSQQALRLTPVGELPASVGQGNLMVANWMISNTCDPIEFGRVLATAPFDCIVLVMSCAVALGDPIFRFVKQLQHGYPDIWRPSLADPDINPDIIAEVLREKAVYHLFGKIFVALHRAKVKSCHYHVYSIRSRGDKSVDFGSLVLVMDNSRQRMQSIKIGILDIRGQEGLQDVDAFVEWLVNDRVAILTGYFPDDREFVSSLAQGANAILWRPMFQGVVDRIRSRGEVRLVGCKNYFILFGYYKAITNPHDIFLEIPHDWSIGQDILDEMIPSQEMPSWDENDVGSVFVPHLGHIKMKDVDFRRWCQGTLQTCLWLGTATPSYSSQIQQGRSRGKQSKGKWKDKGKDKGQGKGKDKGKRTRHSTASSCMHW